MKKNEESGAVEVVKNKSLSLNTPSLKNLEKICNSKGILEKKVIQRLLSELIRGFLKGELHSDYCKTSVYILSVYIQHFDFLSSGGEQQIEVVIK